MARASKIERLGLGERILAMAAEGKSSREIAACLAAENISLSQPSIIRFLSSVRKERAETTKAIVEERLRANLPRDLDILDDVIRQEKEWFDSEQLSLSQRVMVAKELRQAIDTKLKYSGAGEQEQQIVVRWADDDDSI